MSIENCHEALGERCPDCGSYKINWDKAEYYGDGKYFRPNWCEDCDRRWHTVYKFSHVEIK